MRPASCPPISMSKNTGSSRSSGRQERRHEKTRMNAAARSLSLLPFQSTVPTFGVASHDGRGTRKRTRGGRGKRHSRSRCKGGSCSAGCCKQKHRVSHHKKKKRSLLQQATFFRSTDAFE